MRQKMLLIGRFFLIALFFALPWCGVDFFPAFVRPPIQPDPFSFTAQNGIAVGVPITSNSITVSGLTGATSPISITGPVASASKYSINGATATDTAGTVKNGDTVTVVQTSSTSLGTPTTSTLTIGNLTGAFTTDTQTVQTPVFTSVTPQLFPGFSVSSALITSNDLLGFPHVISITGANAQFSITDASNITTFAFPTLQASVTTLSGQHILLKIPVPVTDTFWTLTIDNTNFKIDTTSLAVTATPK